MKLLWQLFITFARIGVLTFGGGLTMLPMLKYELVEKHKWITEEELLNYYSVGQCTPGIIAVNTATFVGYKKKGVFGGIVATLGMVMPSLIIILLVASVLSAFIDNAYVGHALSGIRAAACALMVNTVVTLVRKNVVDIFCIVVFLVALAISLLLDVPSVAIVFVAGILGVVVSVIKRRRAAK